MKKTKQRFEIDFFEFSFLVEACIPPRPIARAMFWDDVINKHYHDLTENERERLFEWIQKNPCFDLKNPDCKLFYDRFNPDNQYLIHANFKGKEEVYEVFKHQERYHKSKDTSIVEEYITKIEKL